jgi:histone H3/H4
MAESVIVTSKVKAAIKEQGMRTDGSLPDALNDKIHAMLKEAAGRAKENGRSTVRPHDL